VRRRAAAAVVAVLALGGCGSTAQGGDGSGFVSGDGTVVLVAPAKRPQPLTLRGTTLDGKPFDLSAFRGKPVVLNVWGSWCAPCRKEAPELQKASVKLAAKGVAMYGLNVQEADQAQALAFEKTFGITYPSLADDGGQTLTALRGAVAPNAIPSTVVVDAEGRVAARISGATTATTLTDLVDDVLAGRASL